MSYRKVLLCLSCLFLSNVLFANTATPSNKSRFIPLLKTKLGNYKVVSASSSLCVDSQLSLINPVYPDAGFKLGSQIVFESLHNGTRTTKKPDFCFVTSSFKYKSDGVDNSLRMSRCVDPVNEKTIRQSIEFASPTTVKYTLNDPQVHCTFEKQAD
ncbi:hypothetical protein [Pseudoalteromonas sp. S3178]|uniref:hypothetical protein n=1 Tax=Pseudoalteromonas sp. S3178 TaxID=579532 RepID=UPI002015F704|nr:hypothetical protein [Pseudoalteromonas sp. S3178]